MLHSVNIVCTMSEYIRILHLSKIQLAWETSRWTCQKTKGQLTVYGHSIYIPTNDFVSLMMSRLRKKEEWVSRKFIFNIWQNLSIFVVTFSFLFGNTLKLLLRIILFIYIYNMPSCVRRIGITIFVTLHKNQNSSSSYPQSRVPCMYLSA